jgi:hypothetical protein
MNFSAASSLDRVRHLERNAWPSDPPDLSGLPDLREAPYWIE